ncbi:lytic transglycosylase domain-containing protein [Rhizobium sp. P32RR-XVIII]|uniref:lytic transglycosylase domain-containing protein n=1 Tax=Rhizobium sp. P32RR-XVIII TaxID=2726738 RepID=UPI0014574BA8|nr:lytic transglycosylase domain-containing protein [Rhizobium sp. P32RR-XVIII]NLS07105.1 lytic transglycosylase domain-containing protein [Rhizobium sp. P32RR-XVIII]
MASKHQITLIATVACLYSAAAQAQSHDKFDISRFYGHTYDSAFPRSRSEPRQETEFEINGAGVVVSAGTFNSGTQDANYNGSFLSPRDQIGSRAMSLTPLTETKTEIVRTGRESASASSPPCGASPASAEEIKALVVESAGRYGVDPDFALAVAWTESRFDQVRNSPKGARGPMQLMPVTAKRFNVTNVCDPADNIDAGMRYLRALLDEFKSPIIAAAAYNAGEQAVYDSGGMPAYPETVRYVASVINRQLGLGFPVKRTGRSRNQTKDSDNTIASDVIGARTPKFIGGVMQF